MELTDLIVIVWLIDLIFDSVDFNCCQHVVFLIKYQDVLFKKVS